MHTNRKRYLENAVPFLSALRHPWQPAPSPYKLTETERRANLTPETILRQRRILRGRHPRAPRSAAAELTRCQKKLPFLDRLFLALFHPTTLFRRPRFLSRNKRRRTHPLRRAKLPQSI